MQVTLDPEIEKFVEEKVRSGLFSSVDQAVNELLSRIRDEEKLETEELRAMVDVGIVAADRGEFSDFTAAQVSAERRTALAVKVMRKKPLA